MNKESTHLKQREYLKEKEKIIKNIDKSITETNNELKSLNGEKNNIIENINNVKKQYFKNFMQKYNLEDLNDFEQFTIEKMNSLSQKYKNQNKFLIYSFLYYTNKKHYFKTLKH